MKRLGLALALALAVPVSAQAACSDSTVDIRLTNGQAARFTVEVAADPATRAKGLMFREEMARSAGMLFLYERPQRAMFWMKNTLIPLDMVFADATGRVTHVHANAIPHDETGIDGGPNVLAILEINGGLAAKLGITPGALLRHPGLEQSTAAWPCEAQ
ncbi:DUF192 domain-containing protein [Pseudorhodobacter sp. E13]|uniref:DUF192 domain-containing protein n=1 Tax=Pseudorhodobacter sp. E13 TaxID=2487931 RepID=UPI000F8C765B|nr:DUF192 domain-containing protein [Pseudorhodobacter sp. E13]RUS60058.1 DUF192 domain-containing protein [Pseudorhodobacter sp. E13]